MWKHTQAATLSPFKPAFFLITLFFKLTLLEIEFLKKQQLLGIYKALCLQTLQYVLYMYVFSKLILLISGSLPGLEIEKLFPPSSGFIFPIIRQIWRYLPLDSFAKNFPPRAISRTEGNFALFAFGLGWGEHNDYICFINYSATQNSKEQH